MTSFDEILAEDYIPTDRPMKIGRYTLGAVIGEGKSSIVRKAAKDGDKKKYAVKVLNKLAGHRGTLIQLQFQQEVEALRRASHENVVCMHDCLHSQRRLYIVLELLPSTLLSIYVSKRSGLPEQETLELSCQLISALAYLHKIHIVHRDLKPENVTLDKERKIVKIIDFGLSASCPSTPHLTRRCGTPAYMAPEVTNTTGYSCAVDMWSLGVSIVEMIQGSAPVLDELHHRGNYPKLVQRRNMFAGLPPLSKDCINFLDRLLQLYPERRMSAADATQHAWIRSLQTLKSNQQQDQQQETVQQPERSRRHKSEKD
ncbi:serine/threonine-protein kinase cds1 [Plakobranchus ocellatus]|uniref:Serine/threonine-protein kinase cds1 n=1 Tax=Plakobranchus ocellatus TaxID=259542 RepID=A0AAV3ZIG8_9GAST|nr:serine/threonine-protein kinase cds1 [Plakobranchus ocellatus]